MSISCKTDSSPINARRRTERVLYAVRLPDGQEPVHVPQLIHALSFSKPASTNFWAILELVDLYTFLFMYFSTFSLIVNSNPNFHFQLNLTKRKKLNLHINVFDHKFIDNLIKVKVFFLKKFVINI